MRIARQAAGAATVLRGAFLRGPGAWRLWQILTRAGLSLAITGLFLWLLSDRLAQIDTAALSRALGRIGPGQWALALALTAVSFWAVGQYDAVVHRHLATGLPGRAARRAGICAIAVSQSLGLGLISGAILRWRMLPGLSLWQATRITAAVALSFLAGWAVVTSVVLLALPAAPFRGTAALGLALAHGLAALCIAAPRLPLRPFRWPNAFTLSRLVGLCALDTIAAALALQVLLPADSGLAFASLLPAFLLALGAGLVMGTPGGMGAFEVTFLALMPANAEAALLPAILAWRVVYYALPAMLGAGFALLGPPARLLHPAEPASLPPDARAEAGLIGQSGLDLLPTGRGVWLAGRRGHCLIALLDPMGRHDSATLDHALRSISRTARAEGRMPVLYKAGRRLAARARRRGMALRRIGWEAWIAPADFRLDRACRAGLRRKLRRAEAAGITVRAYAGGSSSAARPGDTPEAPDWTILDHIAAVWRRSHGPERGFSMGRHDRAHLQAQRLYVAFQRGRPVAYVSFHTAPQEWTLDLMRHLDDLPDGTMHSLVTAALFDAQALGLARLSLAAVTDGAITPRQSRPDLPGRLLAVLAPETAKDGLYRFKSCFAPRWTPLYLAAPSRPGLVLAALSLWRAITRPPPLLPEIERETSDYGFASASAPWHIADRTA